MGALSNWNPCHLEAASLTEKCADSGTSWDLTPHNSEMLSYSIVVWV